MKIKVFNKRSNTVVVLFFLTVFISKTFSQNVAINTDGSSPDASAMLDIVSTSKGLLIPRVALTGTTDVTTVPSAATSLLVYNTATVSDVVPGYYYWTGAQWVAYGASHNGVSWKILGNAGTFEATNFIGTTDNIPFSIKVNNIKSGRIDHLLGNTFFGYRSGLNISTGANNTAMGTMALILNTTGINNTAIGMNSQSSNAVSSYNTGIGYGSLQSNTYAERNVAIGNEALSSMNYTNGSVLYNTDNVAIGYQSLYTNNPTSSANGYRNTAIGSEALYSNTAGHNHVAIGFQALYNNTDGASFDDHTAVGFQSQFSNSTPYRNTSFGYRSLYANTAGNANTAAGSNSANDFTTGNYNVFLGYNAGEKFVSGSQNIKIGRQFCALGGAGTSSGNDNVTIGDGAKCFAQSGDYNVAIGEQADYQNTTGGSNVIIGHQAGGGGAAHAKSGNVFIGYQAGYTETGSNKLYIENSSDVTNPLIYGNFSTGRVGIETSAPSATLDVAGTFKLGSSGTVFTYLSNTTVAKDLPSIAAGGRSVQTFTVTTASTTNSAVQVTPQNAMTGIIIEYARVSAANTIEVGFYNATAGAVDLANMNFYICVMKY